MIYISYIVSYVLYDKRHQYIHSPYVQDFYVHIGRGPRKRNNSLASSSLKTAPLLVVLLNHSIVLYSLLWNSTAGFVLGTLLARLVEKQYILYIVSYIYYIVMALSKFKSLPSIIKTGSSKVPRKGKTIWDHHWM